LIFNSLQFAAFFALVWALVWLAGRVGEGIRLRNACILVASYVFYAAWDWRFLGLIWISTVVDYVCAIAIARAGRGPETQRRRKALVTLSLVVNLGLLGFFKYFGFFVESAAELLGALGFTAHTPTLRIILPVGISFYTFQTLSYTIDVYRGRIPAERDLLGYATYVAFFPQLVAGPIERGSTLLPQFLRISRIASDNVRSGLHLMAWGLFKKVVVADNVAKVSDAVFALEDPSGIQVLLGAYAFAFQIYCDFSGYTDVARGSARCLGFELSLNFDLPYFSGNPQEFWRRWHISLSTWLRDYLYIPLGGNRKGKARTHLNIVLTMVLGGLWHGAAWTFVLWGAFHGVWLSIHRMLGPLLDRLRPATPAGGALWRLLCVVVTFHLVSLALMIFRSENLAQVGTMFAGLVVWPGGDWISQLDAIGPLRLGACVVGMLLAAELIERARGDALFVLRWPAPVRGLLYALGVVTFLAIGEYRGPEFIYFQF
jgi:D-alanyl-lipoteichoic acid acyltransferase DltB (MBOAT superfamily)